MKRNIVVAVLTAVVVSVMMMMPAMASAKGKVAANRLEVVIFHPDKKCPTCAAIKENTLKVINTNFAKQKAAGTISFKEIVYGPGKNEDLQMKYEVAWTTIVLIKHTADGKETFKNLGRFPVENGRTNPDKYRKGLINYIKQMMK